MLSHGHYRDVFLRTKIERVTAVRVSAWFAGNVAGYDSYEPCRGSSRGRSPDLVYTRAAPTDTALERIRGKGASAVHETSSARFVLYVSDGNFRNTRIERNARALLKEHLGDAFELEIVDIRNHPELLEQLPVMATPTLVRVHPEPEVRIIGDLTTSETVLRALGLGEAER